MGNWAHMYSAAYYGAERLRHINPAAIERDIADANEAVRDPYYAALGIGAWATGCRDGLDGSAPRIPLLSREEVGP